MDVMAAHEVARTGTSLDRFRALHEWGADRHKGGLAYPYPPELDWLTYQGEWREHYRRMALERVERERFQRETGIEIFDAVPLKEVA